MTSNNLSARLREWQHGRPECGPLGPLMNETANELDRQRAEIERRTLEYEAYRKDSSAENARIRSVLAVIRRITDEFDCRHPATDRIVWCACCCIRNALDMVEGDAPAETTAQPTALEAWETVIALIKLGSLPGNGTDETAERNGLVLAANAIRALMDERARAP